MASTFHDKKLSHEETDSRKHATHETNEVTRPTRFGRLFILYP